MGYGYCQCGCGKRTKPYYNSFRKYFHSTHNPLRGSQNPLEISLDQRTTGLLGEILKGYEKGWGYCQCGCGERTKVINGIANRYIIGHKSKTPEFRAAQSLRASEQIRCRDNGPFMRYGNSINGVHFSPKLGRPVSYMSLYEKKLFEILDSMESVASYSEQPITIPYKYKDQIFNYTPDVLVDLIDGGRALLEVKPVKMVKFPRTEAKHEAARSFCREKSMPFIIVTEEELFRQNRIIFP